MKVIFRVTVILLIHFFSEETFSQGTLHGVIIDSLSNEPLVGANVFLQGTALGSAADIKGEYLVNNIPEGTYTVQVRYIGFKTKEEIITITSYKVSELNFSLTTAVIEGQEVIVTAQAKGQIEAINQQLNSNTIVNIVSKAKIQELPDANVAESVGRLPGVSIIRSGGEGTEVVIRGMEPKFNLITINGVRVPSTDINDRSVDLRMFAVDMLDGIELTKAITPDKDADAVGGIVDFKFSRVPEGLESRVMVQKGYNGHSESFHPFKVYGGFSSRFFNNALGGYFYANYEQVDRSAHQFTGNYDVQGTPLPGEEFVRNIKVSDFSLRDVNSKVKRFGVTANLDYDFQLGTIRLFNTFSYLEGNSHTYYNGFNLTQSSQSYRLLRNIYDLNLLTNSIHGDFDFSWIKTGFHLSHSYSKRENPTNYYVEFQETSAFTGNIANHINEGPAVVQTFARNNIEETGLTTLMKQPSSNKEQIIASELNFTIPITIEKRITSEIKTGAKFRYTYKNANVDYFQSVPRIGNSQDPSKGIAGVLNAYPDVVLPRTSNGQIQILPFLDPTNKISSFMDGKYKFGSLLDLDKMEDMMRRVSSGSYYLSVRGDINDNIDFERIAAGYFMTTINVGEKLMILPGFRYESEFSDYKAAVVFSDADLLSNESDKRSKDTLGVRKNEFWFPMMHVRYKFNQWFDVRVAATKAIIRPDYRYLVPKYFENNTSLTINRGDTRLKPALSQNFDLSFALHSNEIGLFTVSGFYKEISDMFYPITSTIISKDDAVNMGLSEEKVGYQITQPINNANKAYIRGIEFDFQTRFWYLPGFLSGIVLNINYTKMSSKTYYPRTLLVRENLSAPPWFKLTRIDTSRSGRLLNQPNDVLNCSIGYDYGGFSGRVSVLFQGNTLSKVGTRPELDGFTNDLVRFDLSVKQNIIKNLQVFFNLNNFTNSADISTEPINAYETAASYYQWTTDLGIRYIF